jgi:histidinol-phosphate aminotransferase
MNKLHPEERLASHLRSLNPYVPGEQPSGSDWIKLNTNELPYGVPAAVSKAIQSEIDRLRLYPEPSACRLREALAKRNGLSSECVIIGNGSDELLNLLARAFGASGTRVVQTMPSYSLYPVVTALAGGELVSIPFDQKFALPVKELLQVDADLVFLTCPNAPTGVSFPMEAVAELADGLRGLLVVDEAYVEFSKTSMVSLLEKFDNLVVTRTFSKAYGLAGLRVGYAFADPRIIAILDRLRDSYNVNRISQAGALAALECDAIYAEYVKRVCHTRDGLADFLRGLGWHVYPSQTNFVFGAPLGLDGKPRLEIATSLYNYLKARRILVRHFPSHLLTAGYLRITVGTEEEIKQLTHTIEEWNLSE